MTPAVDAWQNVTMCATCGRESCEEHVAIDPLAFPEQELEDAVDVAAEGRELAKRGVPYLLEGVIPNLGMLGFIAAYAKVGKTTFTGALGDHVSMGRPFLDRETKRTKVLVLTAEDPPEYTAWLARHRTVEPGWMKYRRLPLVLTTQELRRVIATVQHYQFGLVMIASWQAVVRGLIRDENDNAGSVQVVENVKAAARESGVPWLIDAHSGKGEAQEDDADPSKAMRGASAAAGAADYTLSLRYANGPFGSQRRLSGKGRFVSFPPIVMDFDETTGLYTVTRGTGKSALNDTTWRLICDAGALDEIPRTAVEIARLIGVVPPSERPNGAQRRRVTDALAGRAEVGITQESRRGQKTTLYRRLEGC